MDELDKLSCSKWNYFIVIVRTLASYWLHFRVPEEETLEMSDMEHSASEDHKELEEKPKKKKRRRREVDMVWLHSTSVEFIPKYLTKYLRLSHVWNNN